MKKLQLLAPNTYWRMPKKTREEKYEGCGPGHLGNYIVPDTIWGLAVTEACRIHDHEYEIGETNRDKSRADLHLLRNLTILIYNSICPRCLRKWRMRRAFSYYKIVRKFGYQAFWQSKN